MKHFQPTVCIGGANAGRIVVPVTYVMRLPFVNANGEYESEEYRLYAIAFGGNESPIDLLIHESLSTKEAVQKLLDTYSKCRELQRQT